MVGKSKTAKLIDQQAPFHSIRALGIEFQSKRLNLKRERERETHTHTHTHTRPLEQAARQASPSKRYYFFSAAAEIPVVFSFVIPSSPFPLSLPHVVLP